MNENITAVIAEVQKEKDHISNKQYKADQLRQKYRSYMGFSTTSMSNRHVICIFRWRETKKQNKR